MEMIRHNHELVEQIFALTPITQEDFNEQTCGRVPLEQISPLRGDGGDEECAIHEWNVAIKKEKRCAGSHEEIVRFRSKRVLVEERRFSAT